MSYTGQNKAELFAENAQIIKKDFVWQHALTKRLAALLYAQEGRTIDCDAIRQCHSLIKQNTGAFSTFRGNMALCVAALLSLSRDPREVFGETLKVYDLLKGEKLRASDYLVVAACLIAARSGASDYSSAAARTRAFYDGMRARHFFITSQDDYIFAAMLGLTDLDPAAGSERIERLFGRLKGEFWDRNSVQALAQVLVLGGSDDGIIDRVLALRDTLRARKIRLDKTYTLPVMGVLTMLPVETDRIARDIAAIQDTLRAQKGFGVLSVPTQELLLYAASIAASEYAKNVKDGVLTAALSTSVTNIIIAQQAAMIAAVSASTAASSASS
ncbi:MAG: DUF4003 family protein [Clostridiales bacterium]|nr:DUF4003 family protein [Clostridiales bacterium]